MARPKKYDIDTTQVQKLAQLGCTNKEMADFFGCSADLLEKSYSEFLLKGRAEQKICLLYTSPSPRDRTRSRMPSSA